MRKKILACLGILVAVILIQGVLSSLLTNYIRDAENNRNDANTLTTEINYIEMQHYKWLQELTIAVYDEREFTGTLDADTCSLGAWLGSANMSTVPQQEFHDAADSIVTPHREVHAAAAEVVALLKAGNQEGAEEIFEARVLPNIEETIRLMDAMNVIAEQGITEMGALSDSANSFASVVSLATLIVGIILSVIMGYKLLKDIVPPLKRLTAVAQGISQGDVSQQVEIHSKDEFGELAQAFREMSESIREQADVLARISEGDYTMTVPVRSPQDVMNRAINHMLDRNNEMISELRASAEQVAGGAVQIATGAQSLAAGSTEQAASIAQFSEMLSEVRLQAEQNNETATTTLNETQEAGRLMGDSSEYMRQMTGAMEMINESSQNISKVIKVIDDIAFQTNILALNAAVEAARAGQHGKGFAVVADEVRNLASKSAAAAKETAALIEDSVQQVQSGNEIAQKTSDSLVKVGEIAGHNAVTMNELSVSSERQSEAINTMTGSIEQISAVIQANSATAEESAASAEEMSAQAAVLNEIVARFQLRDSGRGVSLAVSNAPTDNYDMPMAVGDESGFAISAGDKY